jgi:lysophospholipase L1-like esterase
MHCLELEVPPQRWLFLLLPPLLLLAAADTVAGSPRCRIHTDPAARWTPYPWRNAYTPSTSISARAASPPFVTHEYGYCEGGRGPWAWGSNNATVAECMAAAVKLNSTCFDYFCEFHGAANCSCPSVPRITPTSAAKVVACVGDSITAGYLSSCGLDYPHQLQGILGSGYSVTNYGVGGQTMFKPSHQVGRDSSYWSREQYQQALNSSANIVVLMLGTNDAKADRWQRWGSTFPLDYRDMVASFQAMKSKPIIYLLVPPPLYVNGCYGMNATVTNTIFPGNGPAGIRTIAARMKIPAEQIVDIYSLFQGHCPVVGGTPGHPPTCTAPHVVPNGTCGTKCDWVGSGGTDGCHPDDVGYGMLAHSVFAAIRRNSSVE